MVGIYSENRPEWVIAELACIRESITIVPIFSRASSSYVSGILDQTHVRTVFVSNSTCIPILSIINKETESSPKLIVNFDSISQA